MIASLPVLTVDISSLTKNLALMMSQSFMNVLYSILYIFKCFRSVYIQLFHVFSPINSFFWGKILPFPFFMRDILQPANKQVAGLAWLLFPHQKHLENLFQLKHLHTIFKLYIIRVVNLSQNTVPKKILKYTQAVETPGMANLCIVYLTTPKCPDSQKNQI